MNKWKMGDEIEIETVMTEELVFKYAELTGDMNPLHMDEEFAKKGRFGNRICHGMLVASTISKCIAMHLPGPGTIYLSQDLNFLLPVYVGEKIITRLEVVNILGKIYEISTIVMNSEEKIVISGKAKVMNDMVF